MVKVGDAKEMCIGEASYYGRLDSKFTWIKGNIGERDDSREEYAQAGLLEGSNAATDVNNSDDAFEKATCDANLHPSHMANRVFRRIEVAETERYKPATPQRENVINSWR